MQITNRDIEPACKGGLEFLSKKKRPIPGKYVDDIAALKGLLRAILTGQIGLDFKKPNLDAPPDGKDKE